MHNFQEALRQLDVASLVAADVFELGQGAGVRDLGQKLCVGLFRLLLLAQEGVELFGQLFVFKLKPGGRVPVVTDQSNGGVPPAAASVCEYATPTVPTGRLIVVMSNGSARVTVIVSAPEFDAASHANTLMMLSLVLSAIPATLQFVVPLAVPLPPSKIIRVRI